MADATELRTALEYMNELGSNQETRIVCVYELSGSMEYRLPGQPPLIARYDFGQFESHIELAASLLPVPVLDRESLEVTLDVDGLELREFTACLLVTPRGDAALVLDGFVSGDHAGQRVAKILKTTCEKRQLLLVNGQPFAGWLRAEARTAGLAVPDDLQLGQNVHQCVFPGGRLLTDIRAGEQFWRIVNRVTTPVEPAGQVVTIRPPELNYPGITAVGHGRGVSVIAGFAPDVQDTYVLVAIMLITGLSVLRRSRENLFAAMDQASTAPMTSTTQTRELVRSLADQLNDLQLDLEFGVESYLDSVIIPEFIIETFQRSLSSAMGLGVGLEHSSRMLDRLASVIQAKRLALDAAVQEQTERFQERAERRDKVFATTLAIGTLLAVPPALLLAFFAVPGDVQHSLQNVSGHAEVYATVCGPFIVLIVAAWIARRFLKARPPPT